MPSEHPTLAIVGATGAVGREALGLLAQPGDADVAERLRSRLGDRDHRVALGASMALARIEGRAATGELLSASRRNARLPQWRPLMASSGRIRNTMHDSEARRPSL